MSTNKQTNRQTNGTENITSFAKEVKMSIMGILQLTILIWVIKLNDNGPKTMQKYDHYRMASLTSLNLAQKHYIHVNWIHVRLNLSLH